MTRETFNKGFAALFNAYPHAQEKITRESEEVYWMMLRDIPDDVFNDAVYRCLASCKFFPTISELGSTAYPTIEENAPYNAFVYHEPRRVEWQEQVRRMQQKSLGVRRKMIGSSEEAVSIGADEREPPEVRAVRK